MHNKMVLGIAMAVLAACSTNDASSGAGGGDQTKNESSSSGTSSSDSSSVSSAAGGSDAAEKCLDAQERVGECGIHLSAHEGDPGGLVGSNLVGLELLDPEVGEVDGKCGFVAQCASNCILESTCQELITAVLGLPTNYVSCIEYCLQLDVGIGGDTVVNTETGSGGGHQGNLDIGVGGQALPVPGDVKPGAGGAVDVGSDENPDVGIGGGNPVDVDDLGVH